MQGRLAIRVKYEDFVINILRAKGCWYTLNDLLSALLARRIRRKYCYWGRRLVVDVGLVRLGHFLGVLSWAKSTWGMRLRLASWWILMRGSSARNYSDSSIVLDLYSTCRKLLLKWQHFAHISTVTSIEHQIYGWRLVQSALWTSSSMSSWIRPLSWWLQQRTCQWIRLGPFSDGYWGILNRTNTIFSWKGSSSM